MQKDSNQHLKAHVDSERNITAENWANICFVLKQGQGQFHYISYLKNIIVITNLSSQTGVFIDYTTNWG